MIRVTADSNIYISALHFGGLPLQFLNEARAGAFEVAISPPLMNEIRRVLGTKFSWDPARLHEASVRIARFTIGVSPTQSIDAVPTDPDDNRVLECAVESRSDYIVTGDSDLLRLGGYGDIRVVKVAEFLSLLPGLSGSLSS